jgi:hypothetical protein
VLQQPVESGSGQAGRQTGDGREKDRGGTTAGATSLPRTVVALKDHGVGLPLRSGWEPAGSNSTVRPPRAGETQTRPVPMSAVPDTMGDA